MEKMMRVNNNIEFISDDSFISFIYSNMSRKNDDISKAGKKDNLYETELSLLAPISRECFTLNYQRNGFSGKKEIKDYSDVVDFKFLNSLLLYLMPQNSLVVTHS